MPRFVLLRHDHPRGLHWDLMLEDGMLEEGAVLATWELPRIPEIGDGFEARRLFDHPLRFLEYEGPLSPGRGHITRVAKGEFETLLRSKSRWVVRLVSESLECNLELTEPEPPGDAWQCRFLGLGE